MWYRKAALFISLYFAVIGFWLVSANRKVQSVGGFRSQVGHSAPSRVTPVSDADISKDMQVVYPYVADWKGRYVSRLQDTHNSAPSWSGTKRRSKWRKRYEHRHRGRQTAKLYLAIQLQNESLLLSLRPNRKFVARWKSRHFPEIQDGRRLCFWVGRVKRQRDSLVAVSNCNGLNGLIRTSRADFFIEPMVGTNSNAHVLYRPHWENISLQNDQAVAKPFNSLRKRSRRKASRIRTRTQENEKNVNGTRNKPKYLETLIATDHSVINFHGSKHVTHYLLTLLNIVSAVYADPSLGANFKIIVVKVVLLEKGKGVKIKEGNSRASLETVCKWGHEIQKANNWSETHDITLFLTRVNLGGPAGFAPVSGICTQRRSCSLTRDEGLSSAFIMAHEIGHVLGMSHDGDKVEGNTCSDEGEEGSVMAPMVRATFSRFHWSECSKKEFHKRSSRWECLNNKPRKADLVSSELTNGSSMYTLDEQCRMEFGEGFQLCRSIKQIKIEDHCMHLWCSSISNPFMCKTKKGTPLEGTPCAPGKWCVNGICERISKRKHLENPVRNNPRNGGWSEWRAHSDCSRTCGVGVRFRERYCNNPEPAFGGKYCRGPEEDFQLCNKLKCNPATDFRADQCARIHQNVQLDKRLTRQIWRPYMQQNSSNPCKLACETLKSKDIIVTDENVIDGTLCSYDNSHHICVQGKCQVLGCDKILGSKEVDDACGVCTGDGTKCQTVKRTYSRTPPKTLSRVAILPKGARRVVVTKEKESSYFFVLHCRRTRQRLLNVHLTSGPSHDFVAVGTKFIYEENEGNEIIFAPGPLLDEVIVQIYGVERTNAVKVSVNYVLPGSKELDSVISPEEIFIWEEVGWTRCSRNCGGGVRYARSRCQDSRTGKMVKKRNCNLADKPIRKEICNNVTCDYRWLVGEWEYCSHSCGTKGVQSRQIRCVLTNSKLAKTKLVPNTLCQEQTSPEVEQSCNRHLCRGNWEVDPWSPCSATCSPGIRTRNVICVPPENEVFYECQGTKPQETNICHGEKCRTICTDQSLYCKFEFVQRYCSQSSIKDICCISCQRSEVSNQQQQ